MRFLKNKIALAKALSSESSQSPTKKTSSKRKQSNDSSSPSLSSFSNIIINKASYQLTSSTPKGSTSCKNIMKNYSRVLVKFALSKLAVPYLKVILYEEGVGLQDFLNFLKERRTKINCIKSLKELLLIEEKDPEKIKVIKKTFQKISEIFLKFFSVNWIFSSKVSDKLAHLKYRFKMLRRIQNPTYFSYLQDFNKEL